MDHGRLFGREDERNLVAAVRSEEHEPAADFLEAPVLVRDGEPVLAREGRSDARPVSSLGEPERSGRRVGSREMREEEVAGGEARRARGAGLVGDARAEERELVAEPFPGARVELARDVPPLHARVVVRPVIAGEREILLRIERLEASARARVLSMRLS